VTFSCRSCASTDVVDVLSLGRLPLVNSFVAPGEPAPERFPLDVVRCEGCTLVQLAEAVSPETLFRTYAYFSSYSDTFVEHARTFATWAIETLELDSESLVVEAASNDGYLLQFFVEHGVGALGVEPARNVAEVARARGIDTISEFLDVELARRVVAERGHPALVVANNVVAHVPDLNGFVEALATLAANSGRVVIEVPYLRDLVDRVEFDTIYHEHVSYFSLTSLQAVLARQGLVVVQVDRIPVHGGSLRVHAAAEGVADRGVEALLAEEAAWGVRDSARFAEFAAAVATVRRQVHELVRGLVDSGARVAAYGAAAKGVVLANTCDLDGELVDFVADRNRYKQGKLLPGVAIPVRSPEALQREQPDYCLLFAWNLAEEIASQQTAYAAAGGKFIAPVPVPKVLAA